MGIHRLYVVREATGVTAQKSPLPPFITSSLPQAASVRLGLSPEETMKVAQELFEGVDLPTSLWLSFPMGRMVRIR
ncbi:MAG: hypothetical protein EBV05_00830 [Cyanobacteria bacterium WB6_1B_304]|nr:hypothetical protein [Cyanobacteria bacterium WB6_1B_304]